MNRVEQGELLQAGGQGPAGCWLWLEHTGQEAGGRVEASAGRVRSFVSPPNLSALTRLQGSGCQEGWAAVSWRAFPLAMQGLWNIGKGEA